MIYYLVTAKHLYTMRDFLAGPGQKLDERVEVVTYKDFLRLKFLPFGTFVFSDVDRMSGSQSMELLKRWKTIRAAGAPTLNHPVLSLRRYDLLRKLHEEGINRFDAYMMTEHRKPKRFPVFVRSAFDHEGAKTELLADQAALDAELARLRAEPVWPGDKVIVEYEHYADAQGVYKKYAGFRVADRFVPRQVLAATKWVVKRPELQTPELAAEEAAYLDANPHRDLLMRVFDLANIDYGRIDYAVIDGEVQVFEINSNPTIIGRTSGAALRSDDSPRGPAYRKAIGRYIEAMEAIDVPDDGRRITFDEPTGAH
ncbi:MAG: hypothetical protein SGJ07_01630 [Rhodospirillaceae bacterium]|nr:hypothetical protein [Rhodospirillaceae bacterium]